MEGVGGLVLAALFLVLPILVLLGAAAAGALNLLLGVILLVVFGLGLLFVAAAGTPS